MAPPVPLDDALVARLHRRANADRWDVSPDRLRAALVSSVAKALGNNAPYAQIERYCTSLHLKDLALACACADGHENAWDHFVREYRPVLYRAADALDQTGGARELADSLYGEVFGLEEQEGARRSLLRYFHGRSSVATWLRAVLAQRYVDRFRAGRRLDPLPVTEVPDATPAFGDSADPERARYLSVMRRTVARAIESLAPRDRLRLACYYAEELTLAQIGQALGEHEGTVSRQLARARRAIRVDVEQQLRQNEGMREAEIAECLASVVADAGSLDLTEMLGEEPPRKEVGPDRST